MHMTSTAAKFESRHKSKTGFLPAAAPASIQGAFILAKAATGAGPTSGQGETGSPPNVTQAEDERSIVTTFGETGVDCTTTFPRMQKYRAGSFCGDSPEVTTKAWKLTLVKVEAAMRRGNAEGR
jgi:hypothetical protein